MRPVWSVLGLGLPAAAALALALRSAGAAAGEQGPIPPPVAPAPPIEPAAPPPAAVAVERVPELPPPFEAALVERAEEEAALAVGLELALTDAATGAPASGRIRLWRLDVPEDATWTAGDVDLGLHEVPVEGLRLESLAPGSYRAACLAQRLGAPDPPAFELREHGGRLERVVLALELPREREAHVVLFDERGARVLEAELGPSRGSTRQRRHDAPTWPRPRRAKLDSLVGLGGGGGAFGGRLACGGRWRPIHAGARGFPLGSFLEDSRDWATEERVELRRPGGTLALCEVQGSDLGPVRYAAVSVAPESVLRHLIAPDGRDGRDFAEDVRIRCTSVRVQGDDLDAAWRALAIQVDATVEGYAPLSFRYRPSEGEPADRVLAR